MAFSRNTQIDTDMFSCTCKHIHIHCTHTHTIPCIHTCTHARARTHTHTHTHTQRQSHSVPVTVSRRAIIPRYCCRENAHWRCRRFAYGKLQGHWAGQCHLWDHQAGEPGLPSHGHGVLDWMVWPLGAASQHWRGVRWVVSVVWYYTLQTGPPHHKDEVSGGWSVLSGTTPYKQVHPTTRMRCQVGGQCCLVLHLTNRSTPPQGWGFRWVVSVVWYYTLQTGPPHHKDEVSGGWLVLSGTTPHKQVHPTTLMRCPVGGQCCLALHLTNRSTPQQLWGVVLVVSVTDGCEVGDQSCHICNNSQTGPPHNSVDPVCLVVLLAQGSIFAKGRWWNWKQNIFWHWIWMKENGGSLTFHLSMLWSPVVDDKLVSRQVVCSVICLWKTVLWMVFQSIQTRCEQQIHTKLPLSCTTSFFLFDACVRQVLLVDYNSAKLHLTFRSALSMNVFTYKPNLYPDLYPEMHSSAKIMVPGFSCNCARD